MSLEKEHTDTGRDLMVFEELGDGHVSRAQSVARRVRLGRQAGATHAGPWKGQSGGVMEATGRFKQGIGIVRCVFYKDH